MPKTSGSEQVADFFGKLDHPLKDAMETVRGIILSADKEITEHIKWQAPSFCYKGDDRVTFNLHKSGSILLIFHRGAKVKDRKGVGRLLDDATGLLQWITDDRATVTLTSMEDAISKKAMLKELVRQWVTAADD